MAQYTVKHAQNIFDVSMTLYGSIEGIFDLLASNPSLSMSTALKPGMKLEYSEGFILNTEVINAISSNIVDFANSERALSLPSSRFFDYKMAIRCLNNSPSITLKMTGEGSIQVDWGDNTDLSIFSLSGTPISHTHYFNTYDPIHEVRFVGSNFYFGELNISCSDYQIILTNPIEINKFVSNKCKVDVIGLCLGNGLESIDLTDSEVINYEYLTDTGVMPVGLNLK